MAPVAEPDYFQWRRDLAVEEMNGEVVLVVEGATGIRPHISSTLQMPAVTISQTIAQMLDVVIGQGRLRGRPLRRAGPCASPAP